MTDPRRGAYGLQVTGLDRAERFLVPAEPAWPRFHIAGVIGDEQPVIQSVGPDHALLSPASGWVIRMEREPGRVTVTSPAALSDDALLHPLLAHVAAIGGWWAGRESLHAGAYVTDDGVWALLGDRGAGKSSTLAWLAREGHSIVCDDMLVLEGSTPFAGPRALDLRSDAAERFGEGEPLGVVGERERWRVPLAPLEHVGPLRGFVQLAWGDDIRSRPVRAHERIESIGAHRGVRLPAPEPHAWLDLAALPWYELERPKRWEELPRVADELRRIAG
jgi:hypothetical protein